LRAVRRRHLVRLHRGVDRGPGGGGDRRPDPLRLDPLPHQYAVRFAPERNRASAAAAAVTQLAIDLQYRTAFGRADFLVSACNAEALGFVERWPDWQAPALLIHGPAGSGKTHLAHLWQARCGGIIVPAATLDALESVLQLAEESPGIAVDDADRAPEAPLLHLHNWCHERRTS